MAHFDFRIPDSRVSMLDASSSYVVRDVLIPAEITPKLNVAQISLREEGPNFILEHFDTYYSALHHGNTLQLDVVFKAYTQLHKAVEELNNTILFLLDDKESLNSEVNAKMVNVMKMLLYIYIEFVLYLEEKNNKTQNFLTTKKEKKTTENKFAVNKSSCLNALNAIIQREINLFWHPPIVEDDFIRLIAKLCFTLLHNPTIKSDKGVIMDIFGVFGNLAKTYNYGETLVSKLIHSIRIYEHVVDCVPEGIVMMVEQFNCQTLIRRLVKEATEWQTDETQRDTQAEKTCSTLLTQLAVNMPQHLLPEIMYLDKYLAHESVPLRLSVLNVMTEVVLQVLASHEINPEYKEHRNEIVLTIVEHMADVAANVRSKVLQNIARLQRENALPLSLQAGVLNEVITRLKDKAAAVRKNAASCVKSFLEHNPYGAYLQLKKAKEQLTEKKELLRKLEASYLGEQAARLAARQAEWDGFEDELKTVVINNLDQIPEEREDDPNEGVEKIRSLLKEKQFEEAFSICQHLREKTEELNYLKNATVDHKVILYLTILHTIFIDKSQIDEELRATVGLTEEDSRKITVLENLIKYLEDTTKYLQVLDSAFAPMKALLFSQTSSDSQEAIQFFVTAFHFQIDGANEGILEMLKLMKCDEQERRAPVIEAFRKIYLVTDSSNMAEHTTIIVNRLIALIKDVTYNNLNDLQEIIVEWTSKGILDNSVIDRCWQFYTQKEAVSDDDARAAGEILRMASMGRNTIIKKNIQVVSGMMFLEKHATNMMFLATSFQLLAVAGQDQIDIQSKTSPFRIKSTDEIFEKTKNVIVGGFFLKYSYYTQALEAAINFIFKVCSNPLPVANEIMQRIYERMNITPKAAYLTIRLFELLGCTAVKLLGYLDDTVYRELKRRNNSRETNKKSVDQNGSLLMGVNAEDSDAEYILHVLENDVVTEKGMLGQFSKMILNVCRNPEQYNECGFYYPAVTALMRYMLVSNKFCNAHIGLVFKILRETPYPQIKSTILIHCNDLLTRFPNIVDPNVPHIFEMLKDCAASVRKDACYSLGNLILKSMIRAHSHYATLAVCLVDEDEEVKRMCHGVFRRLEQKEHNLANSLPDIFSRLLLEHSVDENSLRYIMNCLFELVDSSKKMDSLVDKFCSKYTLDENITLNRNITYCLTLIKYNDKALRNLQECFPLYKHQMHDAEIYSMFKQILAECNKNKSAKSDLSPIVAEIEASIASIFEVGEDGQSPKRPPKVVKNTKTKSKAKGKGATPSTQRKGRRVANKKRKNSSSGSSSD